MFGLKPVKVYNKTLKRTLLVSKPKPINQPITNLISVKSVLESEFPKLIKLLLDLWMKIEPHQHLMLIKSKDEHLEEDFK